MDGKMQKLKWFDQLNVSVCTYGTRSVVLLLQTAVIGTRFPIFPTLTILHMKER
jgi:hypothetical protein